MNFYWHIYNERRLYQYHGSKGQITSKGQTVRDTTKLSKIPPKLAGLHSFLKHGYAR